MAKVKEVLTAQELKKARVTKAKVGNLDIAMLAKLGKAFDKHRKLNPRMPCCCTP